MTEQKQNIDEKKEAKAGQKPVLNKRMIVTGKDLPISTKHAIAICRFIKNKSISKAIQLLQDVSDFKRAVPMTGELPHRKGMSSGRYPVNASRQFIKLLKNLNANASSLAADFSHLIIHAKANIASRRRFSRRAQHFKRTDVFIELNQNKEKSNKQENKKQNGN